MRQKGFTLIELLAVILILGVISLIAIPVVSNIIESVKREAAKTSAIAYINAVEQYLVLYDMTNEYVKLKPNQTYLVCNNASDDYTLLNLLVDKVYAEDVIYLNNIIKIDGTKPAGGEVTIGSNGNVEMANLIIDNYSIGYTSEEFNVIKKVKYEGKLGFIDITTSLYNTLAIDENNALWGFGTKLTNYGFTENSNYPIKLSSDIKFKKISDGEDTTVMALDMDGNLWAWGKNEQGQLGNGTTSQKIIPTKIAEDIKFNKADTSFYSNAVIDIKGNLYTWGSNYYGQLGTGDKVNSLSLHEIRIDK